jgi:hypothetical protein
MPVPPPVRRAAIDQEPLAYERWPGAASSKLPAGYKRHESEKGVLYAVVQEHLETMLQQARDHSAHGCGFPRFVEQTFAAYRTCGILAAGFTRVRCGSCGFEHLVAFSCKRRGLCPSCEARRMADTAAHLVDRVLPPQARYRQWVLSLPIHIRWVLARDSELRSAVLRIFVRRVFALQRRHARQLGIKPCSPGAVTAIQFFGGAINLNVHYHCLIPDGVFYETADGSCALLSLPAPTTQEVGRVLQQAAKRIVRLLESKTEGVGADDEGPIDPSAVFAPRRATPWQQALFEHPPRDSQRCVFVDGFSLHANTAVNAYDTAGLERLCRYLVRSSFAVERLSQLDDGRICYSLKRPWASGQTELVLDPVTFLRRLALLMPPARSHLTRYHGAFAPAARMRHKLRPMQAPSPLQPCDTPPGPTPPEAPSWAQHHSLEPALARHACNPQPRHATCPTPARNDSPTIGLTPAALLATACALTGATRLRQRYLDWASLLRRVWQIDVLTCPRCSDGRLTVLAAISDPPVVDKILTHLGLPTTIPHSAPPRGPPDPQQLDVAWCSDDPA